MISVRQDTTFDCGIVKFLHVLVLRPRDCRAVQDHQRILSGEMDIQLNSLHIQLLSACKAGQSVFK